MKKTVFTCALILMAIVISNVYTAFGQSSALIGRTDLTGSKLYEYYSNATSTPRLLYPYNSSTFKTTDFLLELKVDGTQTTNGFRLSRASKDYVVELLKNGGYGIYQAGTSLSNYFGSNTAIGGSTAPFQPLTTLHVKGNGLITDKLGIGALTAAPVTTLQVLGNGLITDKLGIGIASAPVSTLQVGGNGTIAGRFAVGTSAAPTANLQVVATDTVTLRFDPGRTYPASFVNSADASCFQFWTLRNNTNPIEKGDVVAPSDAGGYSRFLAFTINPSGEIVSKYAVFQSSVTTGALSSGTVTAERVNTQALQLKANAGEGKVLVSDKSGNAAWSDPPQQTFTQYWQMNAQAKTVYTDTLKVGVLTSNTGNYALAVNGAIGCKELKIEKSSAAWPDYVFLPGYQLPALADVEQFVKDHRHLPGLPPAETIEKEGIPVGEMQSALLKKVEELTLYLVEQQKTIESQRKALAAQQEQINRLNALVGSR